MRSRHICMADERERGGNERKRLVMVFQRRRRRKNVGEKFQYASQLGTAVHGMRSSP